MTHYVWVILAATLLQPPAATPAKPGPEVKQVVVSEAYLEVFLDPAQFKFQHPDIRIAEARLMEAQAALDQVKRKVAIETLMNQAKYDQAKADAASKTKEFERLNALHKSGTVSAEEHAKVAAELQTAKRQLAFAELFKQAQMEAEQAPKGVELNAVYGANATRWLQSTVVSPPAQAQPLHDLMQRKVKFAVKATDMDQTVIGVLERSLKEWDFAGAKVIVRYPHDTDAVVRSVSMVQAVEGENTIGVWLLMLLDDYNAHQNELPEPVRGKHQIYVRDYGLLFTLVKNAPDGAPTLAEFLRQAKK